MVSCSTQLPLPSDFLAVALPFRPLAAPKPTLLLSDLPEKIQYHLPFSPSRSVCIPSPTTPLAVCSILAVADRDYSILLMLAPCYKFATEDPICLGNLTHVLSLTRITPLIFCSPIAITPSNTSQTPKNTRRENRGNLIASSYPDLTHPQYRGKSDDPSHSYSMEMLRTDAFSVFIQRVEDLTIRAGYMAQHDLTWPNKIASPLSIFFSAQVLQHPLPNKTYEQGLSPASLSPGLGLTVPSLQLLNRNTLQPSLLSAKPGPSQTISSLLLLQAAPSQAQPQTDSMEIIHTLPQSMSTQHTQGYLVQDTDVFSLTRNILNSLSLQTHSSLTPRKSKTMATRQSERLLQKKSNLSISTQRSLKNKARKEKIAFNIDSSSHSTPLDASSVLQILQATDMQDTERTEQMIQDAIEQNLRTELIDLPMPTTPLHDVIPPLAIPGHGMLL